MSAYHMVSRVPSSESLGSGFKGLGVECAYDPGMFRGRARRQCDHYLALIHVPPEASEPVITQARFDTWPSREHSVDA